MSLITPQEVAASEVLHFAMSMVRNAQYEILATMNLAEELASPLPREYFFLLQEKIKHGVTLKRMAFGTEKKFEEFQRWQSWTHTRYQLRRAATTNYRRILIIDQSYILFAVEKKDRKFYYSEIPDLIKETLHYFDRVWTVGYPK